MRRPPAAVIAVSLLTAIALILLAAPPVPAAETRAAAAARAVTLGGTNTTGEQPAARRADGSRDLAAVLRLVNRARAEARSCGGVRMPARKALRRHAKLDRAAGDYARLMARRDHFSHTSPDGSDPGDRIRAAGYPWTSYAENIAAGQTTAAQVVRSWLHSDGHCRAIMGPYAEVGIGRGTDPDSRYGTYWVLDLATR